MTEQRQPQGQARFLRLFPNDHLLEYQPNASNMPSAVTLRPLAVLPTKADLDDQVDVDLEAFQLSLDESVSAARSLVDSWIPTNLGPQWDIVISAGPSTLRPLR